MKDKCAKIIIPIFKAVNPTACRIQYRQVARLILARTCPTLSTRPDRHPRHDARRTKQKAHQRWASRICNRIVGHQCYLQSVASLANRLYVGTINSETESIFASSEGIRIICSGHQSFQSDACSMRASDCSLLPARLGRSVLLSFPNW